MIVRDKSDFMHGKKLKVSALGITDKRLHKKVPEYVMTVEIITCWV